MAVEAGARGALMAPDQLAIDYVSARATDMRVHLSRAIRLWKQLQSDDAAAFDAEFVFDAAQVSPRVTWGTSPDQSTAIDGRVPDPAKAKSARERDACERALKYIGLEPGSALEGLQVDRVFIGSCTSGCIEDLRAVASVVGDRKVNPKVRAMVGIDKTGLDKGLLFDLRFDGEGIARRDFVLNRPEYMPCRILVAGENFGCGSRREHAVWGLMQFGIRAIVAPRRQASRYVLIDDRTAHSRH